MNTKMITTNRAEELVKQQHITYSDDDEDYINVTSLFKRNTPTNVIEDESGSSAEVDQEEIKRRCQALSGYDKISSAISPSIEKEGS